MLIFHFRDVSVTTTLLVVTLMNLIFFTGFLQVTVATDESTPKSASSDGNKHLDNIKLASLGSMNMALFAKLGSSDKECKDLQFLNSCSKKAKEIANITDKTDDYETIQKILKEKIESKTTSAKDKEMACKGFDELVTCGANQTCHYCDYKNANFMDIARMVVIVTYKEGKMCNFPEKIETTCSAKQWKTIHKKSYTGECVPDADKLKCVQKVVPKVTDWEEGFYGIMGSIYAKTPKACLTVLDLAKCELTSGCHKCKDNEETELQKMFEGWLFLADFHCPSVPGINETALKIDCNKVPTPKPTVTPTPTSSSKTVIIIVVVVVIVLLIIGGIVVYCCFFAGDKGKKKTGGKQGQKVTGKGGAVSGSKMGSDGKSSSVRGGSKSQVGSKLAADSKVGAGKSVA